MSKNATFHFIITLTVILLYAGALYTGNETETLKNIILIIIGYWFRSIEKAS